MLKRTLAALDAASLRWIAIGLGLLVFALYRMLPGLSWDTVPDDQAVLDAAVQQSLRSGEWSYELLPGVPQTFGAHVLPQYATSVLSLVTGDFARAGLWLSFAGVITALAGLWMLTRRLYPGRAFSVITLISAGGLASFHTALSPNPSQALGMALVVWGMAFFLTALTEMKPGDVFVSGILLGLAGYIRIELSLLWILLALYLLLLSVCKAGDRRDPHPYFAMCLGGLFTVAVVLWPLVHRNISLAGTPLLPGLDAELVLGAPARAGAAGGLPLLSRILEGFKMLLFHPRGPGVIVGLLWPIGVGVCLFQGRHKAVPYFWLPVIVGLLVMSGALSFVTGRSSYEETMLILFPLLFPFAVLPLVSAVYLWLQSGYRDQPSCRTCWLLAGIPIILLFQVSTVFRGAQGNDRDVLQRRGALLQGVNELSDSDRGQVILSDMPGVLLRSGLKQVAGMHGETDWRILWALYRDGDIRTEPLLEYMRMTDVGLIHLSDPENPLLDRLRLESDAPNFTPVSGFRPPHRVVRVDWP